MRAENYYEKETYNGDIGVITDIDQEEKETPINFYNNNNIIISYDRSRVARPNLEAHVSRPRFARAASEGSCDRRGEKQNNDK